MARFPRAKSASTRTRSIARKSPFLFFLFFLLLTLSSFEGRPSETDAPGVAVGRAEPVASLQSAIQVPHTRLVLRLSLQLPPPLLLLLLRLEVLGQEEERRWCRRHCLRRTTRRGATAATNPPVTAAPCASRSAGIPGRFSGRGAFSLRRASYVSRVGPSTTGSAGCALWWSRIGRHGVHPLETTKRHAQTQGCLDCRCSGGACGRLWLWWRLWCLWLWLWLWWWWWWWWWWFGRDCNDDVFVHAAARMNRIMGCEGP